MTSSLTWTSPSLQDVFFSANLTLVLIVLLIVLGRFSRHESSPFKMFGRFYEWACISTYQIRHLAISSFLYGLSIWVGKCSVVSVTH